MAIYASELIPGETYYFFKPSRLKNKICKLELTNESLVCKKTQKYSRAPSYTNKVIISNVILNKKRIKTWSPPAIMCYNSIFFYQDKQKCLERFKYETEIRIKSQEKRILTQERLLTFSKEKLKSLNLQLENIDYEISQNNI